MRRTNGGIWDRTVWEGHASTLGRERAPRRDLMRNRYNEYTHRQYAVFGIDGAREMQSITSYKTGLQTRDKTRKWTKGRPKAGPPQTLSSASPEDAPSATGTTST
jgi:hypothetical protein